MRPSASRASSTGHLVDAQPIAAGDLVGDENGPVGAGEAGHQIAERVGHRVG